MNTKKKGTDAERQLIHMLWEYNYAALRVAGSGSCRYPSPDIIAANGIRRIALECKVTKSRNKHFYFEEIDNLEQFCKKFGCEGYIAIKFQKSDWFFFTLEDLKRTKSDDFSISFKDADTKSLNFKQLLGFF
jgi:holliday junction resolvase Hjr